jgi:hypothetical protein
MSAVCATTSDRRRDRPHPISPATSELSARGKRAVAFASPPDRDAGASAQMVLNLKFANRSDVSDGKGRACGASRVGGNVSAL